MTNTQPSALVHPRLRQRLEDTLERRQAEFEEARLQVRRTVLTVLRLMIRLDRTLGTPGSDRQIECLRVLRTIDEFRGPPLPSQADLEGLISRVSRIGDDVGRLAGSIAGPPDTGASRSARTGHWEQ